MKGGQVIETCSVVANPSVNHLGDGGRKVKKIKYPRRNGKTHPAIPDAYEKMLQGRITRKIPRFQRC
jgi:hypothetical protein